MPFNYSSEGFFVIEHLRFRRVWIGIGVLMVLFVAVLSLVRLPPPVTTFMLHDKLMHTFVYACLMGWFAQIYRHDLTRLVLAIALIALGIGVEVAQGATEYRQLEFLDMIANTSGVVLAWALAYTWVGNVLSRVEQYSCKALIRAAE